MNAEILITSTLECGNVLRILCVSLKWFGDTIPRDKFLDRHLISMEFRNSSFEIPENGFWRSRFVEAVESLSLDVFDKRRRRPVSSLNSTILNSSSPATFPKYFVNAPALLSQ
jgi:hypothetical protein